MPEIPLNINSDEESEIFFKQLGEAQRENPELYDRARIIGARNTLFAALRMRGNTEDIYSAIRALASWDDVHAFAEKYKITERELEMSDVPTLNAYRALKKNPTLGDSIIIGEDEEK